MAATTLLRTGTVIVTWRFEQRAAYAGGQANVQRTWVTPSGMMLAHVVDVFAVGGTGEGSGNTV